MSLSQQNAIRLALVFVLFVVLAALAVVIFLLLLMGHRAAGDLAGLMVLSAQTWSERPPGTRPAFEWELAAAQGLSLAARGSAAASQFFKGGPYLRLLKAGLNRRAGTVVVLASTDKVGEPWHWADLPKAHPVDRS